MDQSEANNTTKNDSSETTQNAGQFETATKGSGPMNSKERAAERANEVKERLVQAGTEARKRFAGTKIGQRVEQTVSQLETKFPDLKSNLQAKAEERLTAFAQSATEAGDLAKNVAKAQVDQVLLNLQHKGLDLSQSNELVQKIGKSVLRRADEVRERLEGSPMAPEWLKDLKLGDKIEGLSQKLTESFGTAAASDDSSKVAHDDSATVHASAAAFSPMHSDNSKSSDAMGSAAASDMNLDSEMSAGEVSGAVWNTVSEADPESGDSKASSKPVRAGAAKATKKPRTSLKH